MEQNAKILANQEQIERLKKTFRKKQRDLVPAIVKVILNEYLGKIVNFKIVCRLYYNAVLF